MRRPIQFSPNKKQIQEFGVLLYLPLSLNSNDFVVKSFIVVHTSIAFTPLYLSTTENTCRWKNNTSCLNITDSVRIKFTF